MDWNQCVVFDWHWLPGYDAAEPQWETIKKEELAGEATLQAQMRSILRMLLAWRRLEIFDDRNREWWWKISSIAFYRIKTITNLLTNINRCRQISFLCVTSVWKFWKGTWGTILYRVAFQSRWGFATLSHSGLIRLRKWTYVAGSDL